MRKDDDGAIAIVVALFAIVLFGFAALVVDVGNASDVKAQAADAADAGALAGARELAAWMHANGVVPDPNLETVVKSAVDETFAVSDADWAACTDASMPADLTPSVGTACIQYSATATQSKVRVRIPVRKVPSTFGGIFGTSSISVSPVAAAAAGQDTLPPCEPCNPPLQSDGSPSGPVSYVLPPGVDSPPTDGAIDSSVDPCTSTPGKIDSAVTISEDCTLTPGVYVFEDVNLKVLHGVTLGGAGVALVFTDHGSLDVEGRIDIAAPTVGSMKDVAVVLEGTDSRSFELGDDFRIVGSLYALDGTTWHTDANDCQPVSGTCELDGDLAVSNTDFPGNPVRVPTVKETPPPPLPSPQPEHLTE